MALNEDRALDEEAGERGEGMRGEKGEGHGGQERRVYSMCPALLKGPKYARTTDCRPSFVFVGVLSSLFQIDWKRRLVNASR